MPMIRIIRMCLFVAGYSHTMYPKSIQKLINLFSKFPTIGPRTAARFVFYLTKLSPEEIKELSSSIEALKDSIKICPSCFDTFDPSTGSGQVCDICSDNGRDKELLCIIEKEADLTTIEKTKTYKGFYFILGGTISLKKEDNKNLRIEELKQKIEKGDFKEVIIALNPTTEGEATTLLVKRSLASYNISITRLGRGLPVGGELEYADPDTLESAFNSRS